MKNILFIIISFFALTSCTHQNQKIKFNLNFEDKKENVGKGANVDLVVVDERQNEILGQKEFSKEEKITISSDENLAETLQKKLAEILNQKGFKKGWNKTLEVEIINLSYQAKREFFVGKSSAEITIKVTVNNNKKQSTFTKNFDSSVNSYHFIVPLESTDAATINNLIRDTVQNIFEDKEVIKKLTE